MMFDWGDYFVLAEDWALCGGEAHKRSAISRAYYCVYNRARQLLERDGVPVPDEGRAHKVVWDTLEGRGKARRRLGLDGNALRELRRRADYESNLMHVHREAQKAMAMARSMMRLLDAEMDAGTH